MSDVTNGRMTALCGGVLLAGAMALASGCAAFKHHQGRSTRSETGQAAFTNQFASSVSPQAQKTATNNPAPAQPADNTAQNRRDADSDALTPLDQGGSESDRRITQDIRRTLFNSPNQRFSFLAKNIKIITINNEVTLRGVVKDQGEKTAIEALAQRIGGVKKINNQLDVKEASTR